MPNKQLSRRQKALTLVPLALLSGAWTASLSGVGQASAASERTPTSDALPDGTKVPSQAIKAPANLPSAGVVAPAVPSGTSDQVVDGASTGGIPSAALSAYQRGAQIINAADKTCNIPWQLIAAIGRVESDHGRYGGNVLSSKGVSQPGIYGLPLNGKNGTQAVQDTDGGQLDKDKVYDRAVGPMQFIPSTWQVVKVDADGDGKRNPQDIDDASLATAVYLCSGDENLGKTAGQKKAVFRYNHSEQYVDLVLRLMKAYQNGDYTAVPNDASGGNVFSPSSSTAMNPVRSQAKAKQTRQNASAGSGGGGSTGSGGSTGTGSTGSGGTGSVTGSNGGSTPGIPKLPVPSEAPPPVKHIVKTLNQLGQTAGYCAAQLGSLKNVPGAMSKCEAKVGNLTQDAANSLIGSLSPKALLALLGIKLPLGLG